MGRILIVFGMAALAFAFWALAFGQSVKPLGQVADGLSLWSVIAIGAGLIGIADTAIGAYLIAQTRRAIEAANPGPKR